MRWIGVALIAIVLLLFAVSRPMDTGTATAASKSEPAEEIQPQPKAPFRKIAKEEPKGDAVDIKYRAVREGFETRKKYLDLREPE